MSGPNRWVLWVLGIGILGPVGIGYWTSGTCGYWVLKFSGPVGGRATNTLQRLTLSTPDCPEDPDSLRICGSGKYEFGQLPVSVAHTNTLCNLPGTVFRQLETICSVASEKSVEGTADIRRLNQPQMPFVCTVVLVPGSERWREIHLPAADTSSTHGHGHGHVTAVKGGVTTSILALVLALVTEGGNGPGRSQQQHHRQLRQLPR